MRWGDRVTKKGWVVWLMAKFPQISMDNLLYQAPAGDSGEVIYTWKERLPDSS